MDNFRTININFQLKSNKYQYASRIVMLEFQLETKTKFYCKLSYEMSFLMCFQAKPNVMDL